MASRMSSVYHWLAHEAFARNNRKKENLWLRSLVRLHRSKKKGPHSHFNVSPPHVLIPFSIIFGLGFYMYSSYAR